MTIALPARLLVALAAALVLSAAAAATAYAGPSNLDVHLGFNGAIIVDHDPCSASCKNRITITRPAAQTIEVRDLEGLGFVGNGCSSVNATTARCPASEHGVIGELGPDDDTITFGPGVQATNVGLGSGDDIASAATTTLPAALQGEAGNDSLSGGSGNDVLVGDLEDGSGSGNDALSGGSGNDTFDGGKGRDTFVGGPDVDKVSYDDGNHNTGVFVNTLDGLPNDGSSVDQAGGQRENVSNDVESVTGSAGPDNIQGNDGDGVFNGLGGNDVINAGGGNDTLIGSFGADVLEGAEGSDTADYSDHGNNPSVTVTIGDGANDGNAVVDANGDDVRAGTETVIGTQGADRLTGGTGQNVLIGREGDDALVGGEGPDVLDGGPGDDTFGDIPGGAIDTDPGGDTIQGGPDIDSMTYASLRRPVTVTLNDVLSNDGPPGELDSVRDVENLTGTQNDDTLVANPAGGTLRGLGGDDTLTGGNGPDILQGGLGADHFTGGGGLDTIDYADHTDGIHVDLLDLTPAGTDADANGTAEENDTLTGDIENATGGAGPDFIAGTEVSNLLTGGAGDDRLIGRGGDDTVIGDAGRDVLDARKGNDVLLGVDGEPDTFLCGDDFDTGVADLQDTLGADCEQISQAAVDQHPTLTLPGLVGTTKHAGTTLALRAACPREHPAPSCSGRLAVQVPRTTDGPPQILARSDYRVRRGDTEVLTLRVSPLGRRLLATKAPLGVEAITATPDPKGRGTNRTTTPFTLDR